mmetsp:Transcript_15713/g.18159  ORF Transcript_15713/g.18159 Transcript_15713/m.18159 type:complete len:179 (-) Transcript_15713:222-758(-)
MARVYNFQKEICAKYAREVELEDDDVFADENLTDDLLDEGISALMAGRQKVRSVPVHSSNEILTSKRDAHSCTRVKVSPQELRLNKLLSTDESKLAFYNSKRTKYQTTKISKSEGMQEILTRRKYADNKNKKSGVLSGVKQESIIKDFESKDISVEQDEDFSKLQPNTLKDDIKFLLR